MVDRQVQLPLERHARRGQARPLLQGLSECLQPVRLRSLLLVAGIKLRHHIRLPGLEQLLENGLRRSKRKDRLRIVRAQPSLHRCLQGSYLVWTSRLEIEFRLRYRQLPIAVQEELLLTDIGSMQRPQPIRLGEQRKHPIPVLLHMDRLVPLHPYQQLPLVDLRHPTFRDHVEQQGAQRQGHRHTTEATLRMGKDPIHPSIVEPIQRMGLNGIMETVGQRPPTKVRQTVDPLVKYGKQQDTGQVGGQ